MTTARFTRLLLAGLSATLALTVFFYPAYVFGVPMLDFATTLGAFLGHEPIPPLSEIWWHGVSEHLFNGTLLFPLLYSAIYPRLSGPLALKGAAWGMILFLVAQYFFVPLQGLGLFSSYAAEPEIFVLAHLLGCLFYGVVFATAAGHLESSQAHEEEEHESPTLHPVRSPLRQAA